VSGSTTAIDVETIRLPDTFIHLAVGNPSDITDTGIVSHYVDSSGGRVAGLIRDADLKRFKFIQSLPASNLPVDSSGAVVLNSSSFQLAPVDASDISVQGLLSSNNLQIHSGRASALSVCDLFVSTLSHGAPGLSIGANFITANTTNISNEIAGTISTSSLFSQNVVEVGPWRLSNVQRTYNGTTHDELVFTHTTSGKTAFRIRQPEKNP
jgi:hypothetical protein